MSEETNVGADVESILAGFLDELTKDIEGNEITDPAVFEVCRLLINNIESNGFDDMVRYENYPHKQSIINEKRFRYPLKYIKLEECITKEEEKHTLECMIQDKMFPVYLSIDAAYKEREGGSVDDVHSLYVLDEDVFEDLANLIGLLNKVEASAVCYIDEEDLIIHGIEFYKKD